MALEGVELVGDVPETALATGMPQQRATFLCQHLDSAWVVPHAVVDVVGILLLVAARQCVAFHRQQSGD